MQNLCNSCYEDIRVKNAKKHQFDRNLIFYSAILVIIHRLSTEYINIWYA